MQLTADMIPYGGAAFFAGSSSVLKAGPGAILSGIIKGVEKGPWSHCGYVEYKDGLVMLFESTIWDGVSGPQWNVFSDRTIEYRNGGMVVVVPYHKETAPDPTNIGNATSQLIALRMSGNCHYAVGDLFADLINYTLLHRFLHWAAKKLQNGYSVVCSECLRLVTDPTANIQSCKGATPEQEYERALTMGGPPIQVVP
jgi:hypothetical protein